MLQSTLTSCVDKTTKCKIDKALYREGLAKSTAATESTIGVPITDVPITHQDSTGCVQTPLWALALLAATGAMAL